MKKCFLYKRERVKRVFFLPSLVRFNLTVEQMYEPPGTITIPLRTLTPIWTGGATPGKVDRLRETGIIGSMRWWFEVLVRGVGGFVSDPVGGDKTGLDLKLYNSLSPEEKQDRLKLSEAGLCDVSYIFGATNWKRRFRLEIVDDGTIHDRDVSSRITLTERRYQKTQRNGKSKFIDPSWYFPVPDQDKPCSGEFGLKIVPLDSRFDPNIIAGFIQFIADWAALGSRPQMGFGVVEVLNGRQNSKPLLDYLKALQGENPSRGYPSLNDFFFLRLQKRDRTDFINKNVTFLMKCDLRRLFSDKDLRHNMMGSIHEDPKLATKIKISRPYFYNGVQTLRIWGWIPSYLKITERSDIWNKISSLIDHPALDVVDMHTLFDLSGTQNHDTMSLLERLLGGVPSQEERHA